MYMYYTQVHSFLFTKSYMHNIANVQQNIQINKYFYSTDTSFLNTLHVFSDNNRSYINRPAYVHTHL